MKKLRFIRQLTRFLIAGKYSDAIGILIRDEEPSAGGIDCKVPRPSSAAASCPDRREEGKIIPMSARPGTIMRDLSPA